MAVQTDEIAFVYPLRPLPPQKGGSLSIYTGQRHYPYHVYQTGNGFLDVLKGIGRFMFPIITSSAGTFISNAARRYNGGKEYKRSRKGVAPRRGCSRHRSTGTPDTKRERPSSIEKDLAQIAAQEEEPFKAGPAGI